MNRTTASQFAARRNKPWQSELNTDHLRIPTKNEVLIMERFDDLSKLLARSVSRRESLRGIGTVLAGAVFGSLEVGTAWAARPDRCTAFCRSCPTRKRRNQCVTACRSCNGNTNRLCGSCGSFFCCPTGTACCNGTCASLSSDPHNCAGCGNVCPASAPICDQGTCRDCPPGTDFLWDSRNCGGCGIVCPAQFGCSCGIVVVEGYLACPGC